MENIIGKLLLLIMVLDFIYVIRIVENIVNVQVALNNNKSPKIIESPKVQFHKVMVEVLTSELKNLHDGSFCDAFHL